MIIEIRKAGFVNKGAELMLNAILEKIREVYPDSIIAMAPNLKSTPYEKRAELRLFQKVSLWRHGVQFGYLGAVIPEKIRKMYGIVLDKEVDIVLDAAGFAYSDQFNINNCLELANSCKRWKKNGTKVILLPQAFGPFSTKKIEKAMKVIVKNADLIFAREPISYEHLVRVVGEQEKIKIAPDFTNLLSGILDDDFNVDENQFCIVPNYRMIDKTSKEESEAYIPFLIKCVGYLLEKGKNPFILIHEGKNDLKLAKEINDAVGGLLPIVIESNPLKIKGIISACEGLVGSRFHAIVSALSQGVPAIATGWSHKYMMLFEDYGFSEGIIAVDSNRVEIKQKLDLIIDGESRESIKSILTSKSEYQKKLSNKMWQDVLQLLNK